MYARVSVQIAARKNTLDDLPGTDPETCLVTSRPEESSIGSLGNRC